MSKPRWGQQAVLHGCLLSQDDCHITRIPGVRPSLCSRRLQSMGKKHVNNQTEKQGLRKYLERQRQWCWSGSWRPSRISINRGWGSSWGAAKQAAESWQWGSSMKHHKEMGLDGVAWGQMTANFQSYAKCFWTFFWRQWGSESASNKALLWNKGIKRWPEVSSQWLHGPSTSGDWSLLLLLSWAAHQSSGSEKTICFPSS